MKVHLTEIGSGTDVGALDGMDDGCEDGADDGADNGAGEVGLGGGWLEGLSVGGSDV